MNFCKTDKTDSSAIAHNDALIGDLFEKFSRTQHGIEFDFRKSINWIKYGERGTHYIHPYPAKLLLHIPYLFVNNTIFCKKDSLIVDPFCGSGTVLLETAIAGKKAIGVDINPLGVLISRAKTTKIDTNVLQEYFEQICSKLNDIKQPTINDVINIDYWYDKDTQQLLGKLYFAINSIDDLSCKNFFLTCFSAYARKVSFANPNFSVPVKIDLKKYKKYTAGYNKLLKHLSEIETASHLDLFKKLCTANISRMKLLSTLSDKIENVEVMTGNSNNDDIFSRNDFGKETVDLVITSPPYVGAQKYIRSSSLNLGWLNMANRQELRGLDSLTIGREHFRKAEYDHFIASGIKEADEVLLNIFAKNKKRACIASRYLIEMRRTLQHLASILKPSGHIVIVVGNNSVCGHEFKASNYIKCMLQNLGFEMKLLLIDNIHSRGLMTKRNISSGIINREYIIVMQRRF